jgi:fatty acid desaturase
MEATVARNRGLAASAHELTALGPGLVLYNLAYLGLAWVVAVGAIALFWAHPRWYTFILAFLIVSSRQQALLNCEHEANHRKFLPSRRWNDLLGTYSAAAPVGSPFGAATARHLSHHRLLGTDEDPDRVLHEGPDKRTRVGLVKHFVGGLTGSYAAMVLMGPPTGDSKSSETALRDLISIVVVQAVIAVTLTLVTAWWVYLALWVAPLITLTTLCHLIRSFTEHAITEEEQGGVHANRLITIRSNLLERGLISPYFMNYHAEHHLLPSVPAPRLKELQTRVGDREDTPPVLVRNSYGEALRHYLRALPR